MKKFVLSWLMWLSLRIRTARRWAKLLQPARACLIASALAPILFCVVDQGRDILRELVGEASYNAAHDPVFFRPTWHLACMYAGLYTAGLASWAWARFMLDYQFPGSEEFALLDVAAANKWQRRMRRFCGMLPALGMACGFAGIAWKSPHWPQCLLLAGGAVIIIVLLWRTFEDVRRKRVREKMAGGSIKPALHRFRTLRDVHENPRVRRAIYISWGISGVIFIALTVLPVTLGEFLGSSAVLLFAIASWISVGSAIIFAGDWHRAPALTIVFLWAVLCSASNDNHRVRTLDKLPKENPQSFTDALESWHNEMLAHYQPPSGQTKYPLYLVASAGGGIRAGYWTAAVLGELEDNSRSNGVSFSASTFAMSGVSGGSLGQLTFVALKTRGPLPGETYRKSAAELLDEDFLAADVSKMAFADLFQRFFFLPIRWFDRARSLEDAWAAAWKAKTGVDTFNESLGQLYASASPSSGPLPHVLLNGTCVETGQRIITSDLQVVGRMHVNGKLTEGGEFLDAIAASDKLSNAPIRLSTAAHQSARFTYFSPAGRFPDGTHIVDGGYFENSGATTLMDALEAIKRHIKEQKWKDVTPMLVLIDNNPIQPETKTQRIWVMRETLSPLVTFLNAWNSHTTYAFQAAADSRENDTNYLYEFHIYQRPYNQPLGKLETPATLPLGWALSRSAIEEMNAQLTQPFDLDSSTHINNQATIAKIVATLPKAR